MGQQEVKSRLIAAFFVGKISQSFKISGFSLNSPDLASRRA